MNRITRTEKVAVGILVASTVLVFALLAITEFWLAVGSLWLALVIWAVLYLNYHRR